MNCKTYQKFLTNGTHVKKNPSAQWNQQQSTLLDYFTIYDNPKSHSAQTGVVMLVAMHSDAATIIWLFVDTI